MRYGKAPDEANNNMSKVGVAPWFYMWSGWMDGSPGGLEQLIKAGLSENLSYLSPPVHSELQRLFQCVAMQSKVIKGVDDEDGKDVDDEDGDSVDDDDDDGVQ